MASRDRLHHPLLTLKVLITNEKKKISHIETLDTYKNKIKIKKKQLN